MTTILHKPVFTGTKIIFHPKYMTKFYCRILFLGFALFCFQLGNLPVILR